ncbi:quinone-dependent dihydroorotate dehydrogenase [Kribbella sp.]|uniref:quinone-dependent dihydroorotate dehydrogenase n=1 Tax=Kribbella sp. TaxID=1871183 RepID=UPI002D387F9D|nr:quinone-dependent dihydroorotate dehydrogenase [Kribbella sp.]HZX06244.1 quinone-dependent dihydroorotate dehydrogenase [Kribbella sp.]
MPENVRARRSAYERVVRPALYRLGKGDAEVAHEQTLAGLRLLGRIPGAPRAGARLYGVPGAARTVFGVRFPSPVGLAAGMDKNGVALRAWPAIGFGFVEVGTVTAHPQPGNEKPRLFRLVEHEAVINRMGFNNLGSAALAERLAAYGDLGYPLGISIGKSKITPLDEAVEDYVTSLRRLYRYGDYFAVNVSSPNTPGLRELQDAGHLRELLTALHAEAAALTVSGLAPKPILVKIAPDLTTTAIDELLQVCTDTGVAGIIATNTTITRAGVAEHPLAAETGGLSGRPLTDVSAKIVAHIHGETGGALPVIGVGGIVDPSDAHRLFDAGASLVQVYTGLIYKGPGLIRQINRSLP